MNQAGDHHKLNLIHFIVLQAATGPIKSIGRLVAAFFCVFFHMFRSDVMLMVDSRFIPMDPHFRSCDHAFQFSCTSSSNDSLNAVRLAGLLAWCQHIECSASTPRRGGCQVAQTATRAIGTLEVQEGGIDTL